MQTGRAVGWRIWRTNRRLTRLVAGAAILAVPGFGLLFEAAPELWWGFTHGWTAHAFGESFKLPVGWREVATPAGQQTLVLRNRLREVGRFGLPDEIRIREAQGGFDAVEMAQRWERLEVRWMIPGDRLEPTPADAFLRDHYRCSDIKRDREGRVNVACFDKEGRWVVTLLGRDSQIRDLSAIMQGPVTEGRP